MKICHLARTRTWNWVAGFRQIIADSYSFDNALVAKRFSEENSMPTFSKSSYEKQIAGDLGQIETTEMIEVQLVNSVAPFLSC
jgi:hypothetical protein